MGDQCEKCGGPLDYGGWLCETCACRECRGAGVTDDAERKTCPACLGTGEATSMS